MCWLNTSSTKCCNCPIIRDSCKVINVFGIDVKFQLATFVLLILWTVFVFHFRSLLSSSCVFNGIFSSTKKYSFMCLFSPQTVLFDKLKYYLSYMVGSSTCISCYGWKDVIKISSVTVRRKKRYQDKKKGKRLINVKKKRILKMCNSNMPSKTWSELVWSVTVRGSYSTIM